MAAVLLSLFLPATSLPLSRWVSSPFYPGISSSAFENYCIQHTNPILCGNDVWSCRRKEPSPFLLCWQSVTRFSWGRSWGWSCELLLRWRVDLDWKYVELEVGRMRSWGLQKESSKTAERRARQQGTRFRVRWETIFQFFKQSFLLVSRFILRVGRSMQVRG